MWETSETTEEDVLPLTEEKGALSAKTLLSWGIRKNFLSGDWIIPGYGVSGKITQMYRYVVLKSGKSLMIPTPKVETEQEQGIFGLNLFDRKKKDVYICEGPWDGMVLWELLKRSVNVIAVPGCNVFLPSWLSFLRGLNVHFCYDNDHPKAHEKTGKRMEPASWRAMREVSLALLAEPNRETETIEIIKWSDIPLTLFDDQDNEFNAPEEDIDHNPKLKHGWDVRDVLTQATSLEKRKEILPGLLSLLVPLPGAWLSSVKKIKEQGAKTLECSSWEVLLKDWKHAMHWRGELGDVLSVMLAVATSTELPGDQLFLQVIGDAGSGKSRFCDGMLTSPKCYPLEHLTGFHSGWKDKEGNDYSLLGRINFTTLITAEGDTLISSPHFQEIMSQQRRIFDGKSSASYKNSKEDKNYSGLRTPWIFVGTPVLMSLDQSRLGDRFLRVFIGQPPIHEKRAIVGVSGHAQLRGILGAEPSENGKGDMGTASSRTGGYVNWLRANVEERLQTLKVDRKSLVAECALLAEFTADMRARPDPTLKKGSDRESAATKELPTRLVQQLVRLACCLCVVLNKESPDLEVMRVVRKVAVDTSRGKMLNIVSQLHRRGDSGASTEWIATILGEGNASIRDSLRFLKSIDVVQSHSRKSKNGVRETPRWSLTERMKELCEFVLKHDD